VGRFEAELDGLDDAARASLLERAQAVAEHRFDLLGSGPTPLGEKIDWHADFKTGRRWPLEHISRLPIVYPDGSDIKVPWELSRCQHLPLLAAAHRVSGDRRHLDELGAQLDGWIDANPVELGPNWACTMDVAIRAANWTAALALCGDAGGDAPWMMRALASLRVHCRFIRRHLEWAPVRGNHYLADVAGLLCASAPFAGAAEGRAWARWATDELEREMEHQVRADGCDHEASIPYHRLVCEMFLVGAQAADALAPGRLTPEFRARLDRMLAFTSAYTPPDGLAPQMGDGDDGRFLPLGDYGAADPRDHRHLFGQAGRAWAAAASHAAFPEGGWYVMSAGDLHLVVRCGDVGLGGIGAHAHNDQLSFVLSRAGRPLVIDPGTYVYTADLEARARFRATRFHSTLSLDGREQNRLDAQVPFSLPDDARAEALVWETDGPRARFAGRHHGFRPAVHERRVAFDGESGTVTLEDVVRSPSAHDAEWTFPLAGGVPRVQDDRVVVELPGATLTLAAPGVEWSVEEGRLSPSYGLREPTPFLRARARTAPGEHVTRFTLVAGGP
jgi:hypothetical protein